MDFDPVREEGEDEAMPITHDSGREAWGGSEGISASHQLAMPSPGADWRPCLQGSLLGTPGRHRQSSEAALVYLPLPGQWAPSPVMGLLIREQGGAPSAGWARAFWMGPAEPGGGVWHQTDAG